MDFSAFGYEFSTYLQSEDFRKGIYVEIGGMVVDLLLISILVPLFIWLVNYKKNRHAKTMAAFYTLQFHHATVDVLLKLGGVIDPNKELHNLLKNGKIKNIFSHFFYGNLENLLELLKIRLRNSSHIEGHHALPRKKAEALGRNVEKLLEDLDRYIFLFSTIGLSKYSKKFFEARMLLYPLRDYTLSFPNKDKKLLEIKNEFYYLTITCVDFFEEWFKEEKKFTDKIYRFKYHFQLIKIVIGIPYVSVRRLIMPIICRMRKKPYIDKSWSNFFTLISTYLQVNQIFDIDDVAKKTGINKKLIHKYLHGYKYPSEKVEQTILTYFMQRIQPSQWNELVITTLKQDVINQKPNLVTIEAVKANALHKICIFTIKEDGDEDKIFKSIQHFFNLKPF